MDSERERVAAPAAPAYTPARRVLLITNIPTPYRLPLFNELAKQLEARGARLKVLFGSMGYRRRQWEIDMEGCRFEYAVLSSRSFEAHGDAEKTSFSYAGALRHIRTYAPDVVVVAGFSLATVRAWLYSVFRPLRYIIWTGSIEGAWASGARKRTPRSSVTTLQRKLLARRAVGFIAYGTRAKEYLVGIGAPPERVSIGINTVDTAFFTERARRLREDHDPEDPESRRDPQKWHLVSVGYLSPRKGNLKMLRAIRQVADGRTDFELDVIGDGEERGEMEAYVQQAGLAEHVRFHGYRQKEELPTYLARSCCLLYATDYDIWGLVLVEAMASGLPVIASARAGATWDLVREGETGFAVDFDDADGVAEKVNWILDHPTEAARMGLKAQAFVRDHASLERSAAGFVEAIEAGMVRGAPPVLMAPLLPFSRKRREQAGGQWGEPVTGEAVTVLPVQRG